MNTKSASLQIRFPFILINWILYTTKDNIAIPFSWRLLLLDLLIIVKKSIKMSNAYSFSNAISKTASP